jgi:hypothetical protein
VTRRKALQRWETKRGNFEVTPHALYTSAKLLVKSGRPKAPAAVHGPLGITYYPSEKVNAIADYIENQFTSHALCDENRERRMETRVKAHLASVDDSPLGRARSWDARKLVNSLKLRKACKLDAIQSECSRHLPRRPPLSLGPHSCSHCCQLSHLSKPWKKANAISSPKAS